MEPVISASKKYYEKNKNTILAKEKENKRWVEYYQRNKEAIRERNIQRYYTKQGRERPEPRPTPPPIDNSRVERLEALVAELRELVPHVIKPKRTKKTAEVPERMTVPVQMTPPGIHPAYHEAEALDRA